MVICAASAAAVGVLVVGRGRALFRFVLVLAVLGVVLLVREAASITG
jgi:hypothetical protein